MKLVLSQFETAKVRKVGQPLIIIMAAAVLSLPCLLVGVPHGPDSLTHTEYQYHFSREFWSGDLYPRWLTGANKGYGSPIFLIQYPLPYHVPALLRPFTFFAPSDSRESRELGRACFLALAAAGLAAYLWFRNRCGAFAATTGALVYITLPYILGQELYAQPRLGELWASV